VMYVGHPLSKLQLNAVCTEIEGGMYEYDPPAEVILPLGIHTLKLHYTVEPKYDHDYKAVTMTRTVSVEVPCQPAMYWDDPEDIPYNTPLSRKHLCCKSSVYEGFLLYEPPLGTILEAGMKHKLKCVFTPNDPLAWNNATKIVDIMVKKADPVLLWDAPDEFYAGMKLQQRHLVCCTKDLALADGPVTYKPAIGAIMSEGTHKLTAYYKVPRGWRSRYNDVSKTIDLVVMSKLKPNVVWKNTAHIIDWDSIIYGQKLSSKLLNATCSTCPGSLVYDPPLGTLLNATESYELAVTFTPVDLDKYLITKVTRILQIKKATPDIVWKPKLPFMYVGKPLEPHTMNAYVTTCNAELNDDVPIKGKFIYSPEVGEVLEIGTHTMTTIFEPCKEVSHNYTFASHYIHFLVIKEGTLFKIPKRYTEPEVRPVYKGAKATLVRPFEAPKGDFYFSEIETVADSDRTRRILEAKEESKKRAAMVALEAVVESKSREASREGGFRPR
jgi:large repetitive protein